MTLSEYFKHEVMHEYEMARRQILDKQYNLVQLPGKTEDDGRESSGYAQFHPVFLSSLLNQQVFKRECMLQ